MAWTLCCGWIAAAAHDDSVQRVDGAESEWVYDGTQDSCSVRVGVCVGECEGFGCRSADCCEASGTGGCVCRLYGVSAAHELAGGEDVSVGEGRGICRCGDS